MAVGPSLRPAERKLLLLLAGVVCLVVLWNNVGTGDIQPTLKGRGSLRPVGVLLVADSSAAGADAARAARAVEGRVKEINEEITQLLSLKQKLLEGKSVAVVAVDAGASKETKAKDSEDTAKEPKGKGKKWFSYLDKINQQMKAERGKSASVPRSGGKQVSRLPNGDEHPTLPVRWYAPFFSGGGYCSEAISFVTSMKYVTPMQIFQLGDTIRQDFVDGLDRDTLTTLKTMQDTHLPPSKSITICHTPPSRWEPALWTPAEAVCPPPDALYKIGRTMFETDGIPAYWASRMNKMDAIWVPTKFNYQTFSLAGVYASKLRVVPEAVDSEFFDPSRWEKSKLIEQSGAFNFLSVFKWEERKGWRFLIQAYLEEFSSEDNCVLYILTNQDRNSLKMQQEMARHFVTLDLKGKEGSQLPEIRFLPKGVPTQELPTLYKAADAFVLPSRGEGWGRPHVEAMAMALPVIVTKWSGPEEFLTDENSFPLTIDGLEVIEESFFEGFRWAKPSVKHLRQLMRYVMDHPEEAQARGRQARADMVRRFCPDCVAKLVIDELVAIEKQIGAKPEYSPSFSLRENTQL